MTDLPPEAYLASGLLIYGDLARGASVSRAFRITPPDLLGATELYKEEIHERLVKLSATLAENERLQWQWRCTADFTSDLDAYDAATPAVKSNAGTRVRLTRAARSTVSRKALHERRLRG